MRAAGRDCGKRSGPSGEHEALSGLGRGRWAGGLVGYPKVRFVQGRRVAARALRTFHAHRLLGESTCLLFDALSPTIGPP